MRKKVASVRLKERNRTIIVATRMIAMIGVIVRTSLMVAVLNPSFSMTTPVMRISISGYRSSARALSCIAAET